MTQSEKMLQWADENDAADERDDDASLSIHSTRSSYREKVLERLFIGEVLRHLWSKKITNVEVLRPEADVNGYDIVIACNGITRYIQLKSSKRGGKAARQTVHLNLANKPGGCVIWVVFSEDTLDLGPYLWFGGQPGATLPDISGFTVAKHAKGNAQGVKTERPEVRVIKVAHFERLDSVSTLVTKLFGRI